MAVDVTTDVVVSCPRARVAAFATDPLNAPLWYANIRSVELLTDPPVRVGSRMRFVAVFLGRRIDYTYEVLELVPAGRLDAVVPGEWDLTLDLLPPLTRRTYQDFSRCTDCGRVYWKGAHFGRLEAQVDRLLAGAKPS